MLSFWLSILFGILLVGLAVLVGWLVIERLKWRRSGMDADERLKFETLLSDISADFARLLSEDVDATIQESLKRLCNFLGADRGTFLQFVPGSDLAYRSHSYAQPGIPPAPEIVGDEHSPWYVEQIRRGVVLNYPRMAEQLTDEASNERTYVQRSGIKSHLTVPILVDGTVVCALAFSTMKSWREWPSELIARLRLAGEVFTQSLLRKQAQTSLVDSQHRYSLATAAGGVSVWDYNLETGQVYSDPILPIIVGLPPDTVLSRDSWYDWVHPEDVSIVLEYEKQLVSARDFDPRGLTKGVASVEYRLLHRDGGVRWVQLRGAVVERKDGVANRIIGTVTEITERKLFEEALRTGEERYRNVVETQTELICRFYPDTTLTFVNGAYCRYFEKSPEQLLGTKFLDLIPAASRSAVMNHLQSLITNPRNILYEHEVLDPRGGVGWQQWINHAIMDSHGAVIEFQAVGRDITELKLAGEELRKTQLELQHVSRVMTMGEFMSSIAHEVNQPLAAIRTCGEAGLRFLSPDSLNLTKSREALENIVKDSVRASEVLKRIRSLVKKTASEKVPLDINEVVREAVSFTASELERQSVTLVLDLEPGVPLIVADRIQLQQVMLNLISNSIEAMEGISSAQRSLTVKSTMHGSEWIVVSVIDAGPGLRPEDSRRVFEAFFSTKPDGMGLGLSISKTIIESHGGKLWAPSNGTKGGILEFKLPVNSEKAE